MKRPLLTPPPVSRRPRMPRPGWPLRRHDVSGGCAHAAALHHAPTNPWTIILLGLRVLVLALVIVNIPAWPSAAQRFHQIASTHGVPYRDFQVEYSIGELGLIQLVGISTAGAARVILALIAFMADLTAFAAVRHGWGQAAGRRYLILGVPLLVFVYRRSDLVGVALAVLGLAFAEKGREKAGGVWLGLAALVKLWPCVLVPALHATPVHEHLGVHRDCRRWAGGVGDAGWLRRNPTGADVQEFHRVGGRIECRHGRLDRDR